MLILTRRVDEAINVGDEIRILVLEVRGHRVRLGIEAPKCLPVHREEFQKRIGLQIEAPPEDADC